MNRILSITLYSLLIVSTARAQQVGVGTAQPDPSAALDISSSNKGLLIPRVDLAANNITTPATGLMVFNTNSNYSGGTGLFINLGTGAAPQWTQLVANTSGNFIRNQTGQQANGNFNIAGSGVIGANLQAKRIAVNKTFPNYELDVNGTVYSNNLYAQSTVLAPLITASTYFNMDVQYIRRDYSVGGNTRWTHTLYCPPGYQIVSGGGGHRDNNSAGWDIKIAYSGPDPSAPTTGWRLMLTNTSGSSRGISMYCNCAKIR
jgi:hypothetical protein